MSGPFYEYKADEVVIFPDGSVDIFEQSVDTMLPHRGAQCSAPLLR